MGGFIKFLILLIIVALAAAPFGVGYLLERQYNDMLVHLNTMYGPSGAKFTGTFTRGYMTSTANTEITSEGGLPIKLISTLHHGPVILDFKGWLDPSSYVPRGFKLATADTIIAGDFNDFISHLYDQKPAYTIHSEFDYSMNGVTTIKNNPLSMPTPLGDLDWKGFDLTVNNNKGFTLISGQLFAPALSVKQADPDGNSKDISWSNVRLEFSDDATQHVNSATASVDHMTVMAGSVAVVDVEKFSVTVSDSIINKLLSREFKAAFVKLAFMQDEYGPFSLNFKIKNVDYNTMNDVAKSMSYGTGEITPEQLKEIVATNPEFDLNFEFTTPKGKIDLTSTAIVKGKDVNTVDEQAMLAATDANISLQISSDLAYEILAKMAEDQIHAKEEMFFATNQDVNVKNPFTLKPDQMQAIVQKWIMDLLDGLRTNNYIQEKDGKISVNVKYANKTANINGVDRTEADVQKLMPLFEVKVPGAENLNPDGSVPKGSQAVPATSTPSTTNNSDAAMTATPTATTPNATSTATTPKDTMMPNTTAVPTPAPALVTPTTVTPPAPVPPPKDSNVMPGVPAPTVNEPVPSE